MEKIPSIVMGFSMAELIELENHDTPWGGMDENCRWQFAREPSPGSYAGMAEVPGEMS